MSLRYIAYSVESKEEQTSVRCCICRRINEPSCFSYKLKACFSCVDKGRAYRGSNMEQLEEYVSKHYLDNGEARIEQVTQNIERGTNPK